MRGILWEGGVSRWFKGVMENLRKPGKWILEGRGFAEEEGEIVERELGVGEGKVY